MNEKAREEAINTLADYVWDNYGDIAKTFEMCEKSDIPDRNKDIINDLLEIMTSIIDTTLQKER